MRETPAYDRVAVPIILAGKYSLTSNANGEFRYPRAISIDAQSGNIFICGFGNDRVRVFNKSLEFVCLISEGMQQPFGVCAHAGSVYVTQLGTHSLTVHTAEGRMVQRVGRKGEGELEFCRPGGVVVSVGNSKIYVVNNRIIAYSV